MAGLGMAHLLPRAFYARDATDVARDLLGKVLVREVDGSQRCARIVETEAYLGEHDLAAHSSKGRTARNEAMWGPPGHAYVYFVYGMHWMLNVVCSRHGDPQAVLLRAAQPLLGWQARLHGPALLAKAFRVTRADNQADLCIQRDPPAGPLATGSLAPGPLRIVDGPPPAKVLVDRRIGVDYAGEWAHAPLRYLEAGSPHVSKPPHPPRLPRTQWANA